MKLFKVDFEPMWPVPSGLIILAEDKEQCRRIAEETIVHTRPSDIEEIPMDKPVVVFYEEGNY